MPALKRIQMIGAPLYLVPMGDGGFNGGWKPKEYSAGGSTYSTAAYTVQSGDTLNALAQRYMGSASRAKEIWDWQTPEYRAKRGSMNNINVGDTLQMPQDAIDGAAALGFVPMSLQVFDPAPGIGPAYKPAGGGTAPKPPGKTDPAPPPAPASSGNGKAIAIGVGLGLTGLALTYAFRKKIKRALVAA